MSDEFDYEEPVAPKVMCALTFTSPSGETGQGYYYKHTFQYISAHQSEFPELTGATNLKEVDTTYTLPVSKKAKILAIMSNYMEAIDAFELMAEETINPLDTAAFDAQAKALKAQQKAEIDEVINA